MAHSMAQADNQLTGNFICIGVVLGRSAACCYGSGRSRPLPRSEAKPRLVSCRSIRCQAESWRDSADFKTLCYDALAEELKL